MLPSEENTRTNVYNARLKAHHAKKTDPLGSLTHAPDVMKYRTAKRNACLLALQKRFCPAGHEPLYERFRNPKWPALDASGPFYCRKCREPLNTAALGKGTSGHRHGISSRVKCKPYVYYGPGDGPTVVKWGQDAPNQMYPRTKQS